MASYSSAEKERALKLAGEVGARQAAREMGIAYPTMLRWRKEAGQDNATAAKPPKTRKNASATKGKGSKGKKGVAPIELVEPPVSVDKEETVDEWVDAPSPQEAAPQEAAIMEVSAPTSASVPVTQSMEFKLQVLEHENRLLQQKVAQLSQALHALVPVE